MVMLSASDVYKHFGAVEAIRGLSLRVNAGEIYGLVGPDGAGKTTFLRVLCGALQASSGTVLVAGFSLPKNTEPARECIGYLPQRFSLYEEMTVLENLRFFAEVRGLAMGEWLPRSAEILDFVGLSEFSGRQAGKLSGGMKQKLGLAAALVHRPKVLLLDEPTTGVDPVTRQSFWQLIIQLVAEESVTVLVSTPYMDEAGRCNRVGFLRDGRLLVEGPPSELRNMLDGRILEVMGRPLMLLREFARGVADVEDAQMFGDCLHLRVRKGSLQEVADRIRDFAGGKDAAVTSVRPVRPGLEDVFISLLERKV